MDLHCIRRVAGRRPRTARALSLTRGNAALHLHHGVALAGLGRTAEAAEINPANPTLVRHLEAARALAGGQAAAA